MRELAELAAELRRAGVVVGTDQVEAATRALAAVAPSDSRLALRCVLCSSRADLERFDAIWAQHGAGVPSVELGAVARAALPSISNPDPSPATVRADTEQRPRPAMWSDVELMLDRDFAEFSPREIERVRSLVAALVPRGPLRRTRRLVPVHGRSGRPHLQRTLRAALRTGGEPVHRHWRGPGHAPRPLVLVLDVSGSMAPYTQMLLLYVHATVSQRRHVEAFAFGTRLTRITHELDRLDAASALGRARAAVADWAGGTRTGEALAALTRAHGGRLGRGAIVVVLSDGWDRGEPADVDREMARLQRVAHRVIWLNPLSARPGYEPLARGMAAALPHVDDFLSGHSLRSLRELGELLDAADAGSGRR
jgi:uncharacterized protein with von Willebrand factor type A (vWA) domain